MVVAGSLAAWAAFPVVYVSQYKDADGNPYYEGAPEGAAVYATLAEGYANVESKGTIWLEDDFVCNEGKVSGHGYSRLLLAKAITMRSRSGDWRTGAEIHGYYSGSVTADGVRCLGINHGGAIKAYGIRFVGGSIGTSGDAKSGGCVKCIGGRPDLYGGPNRFENCLFAECVGGCVVGIDGVEMTFDNCFFTNNVHAGNGNGTGVYKGDMLTNCRFEGNTGSQVCQMKNGTVVSNCQFVSNSGGLPLVGTSVQVRECDFVNNSKGGFSGSGVLVGCLFEGNKSAVTCSLTDESVVSNCQFYSNTSDQNTYSACKGSAVEITDCVFTNNSFTHNLTSYGAFCGSGVIRRCDFIGNSAAAGSGAVSGDGSGALFLYDCNFISNKTTSVHAGACVNVTMASNCTFFANRATGSGTAAVSGSKLFDCWLVANYSVSGCGGASGCVLTDCHLVSNRLTVTSGTVNGGAAKDSTLTNCVVAGNSIDSSSGRGGGLYNCVAYKCVITNNSVKYQGGGVYKGTCTDCLIAGNFSGQYRDGRCDRYSGWGAGCYNAHLYSCVVSNNVGTYRGGGIFNDGVAYTNMNCQIVDNVLCGTNDLQSVNYAGASGVWNGTYFNCLIARNIDCHVAYGRAIHNPYLYNCTVTDNTSCKKNGYAGGPGIRAVNSIIAGNTVTGGGTVNKDGYTYATNSYVTVTIEEAKGSGNVVGDDPKLGMVEGFAYTPLGASPCKNRAIEFSWMRDAGDIRSKDIYGHDRIMGSAPDIGAVERKGYGIMLMVR